MTKSTLRSADAVLADQRQDPAVRERWEETTLARAVALRLVTYRADCGLSQTTLARRIGISQPALARLEAGEHTPSLTTLVRLSDTLGIEFLVAIKPATVRGTWVSAKFERARVIERATTAKGSELLVAAS